MNIDKLIAVAKSHVGEKEITPNKGFVNPAFEAKMRFFGWQPGQSWCAYFVKACVYDSCTPGEWKALGDNLSPSALLTYNKLKAAGHTISQVPVLGALVVWQHGNTAQGHIGIVASVQNDTEFTSVEGNTNALGGREGDTVAEKKRKTTPMGALTLKGFIIL
jgi:hypothetical protein